MDQYAGNMDRPRYFYVHLLRFITILNDRVTANQMDQIVPTHEALIFIKISSANAENQSTTNTTNYY